MSEQVTTLTNEKLEHELSASMPIYLVHYVEEQPSASEWDKLPYVQLVDVVTGETPELQTHVRICWSRYGLHLQFRCEDDLIVSPYSKRDDPLYEADVVEWFIQPADSANSYYEFNISPHNMVFDSKITIESDKPSGFHPEWNAEGLTSEVRYLLPSRPMGGGAVQVVYTAMLPFSDLQVCPNPGDEWRINLFRIDQNAAEERQYCAWSPTGAVQFHVPEKFGRIRFFKV